MIISTRGDTSTAIERCEASLFMCSKGEIIVKMIEGNLRINYKHKSNLVRMQLMKGPASEAYNRS